MKYRVNASVRRIFKKTVWVIWGTHFGMSDRTDWQLEDLIFGTKEKAQDYINKRFGDNACRYKPKELPMR